MSDLQFYPTPAALARRWRPKFTRPITRLLDPSAGTGDSLDAVEQVVGAPELGLCRADPERRAVPQRQGPEHSGC